MIDQTALATPPMDRSTLPAAFLRRLPLMALAIALLVVPQWLGDYWLKAILIPTLIFGLAALGLNFVTGYAGLISLGQAAFMAVGAFAGVIAYGRFGLPIILSLLIAGSTAAIIGAVVGLPSLRIRGLYLLVATLAAQFIIVWGLQRIPAIGAGSSATINTPPVFLFGWRIATAHEQYYFALGVVSLMTIFGANLVRSRIGRAWMAIRDHEVAATVMGISMLRYKLLGFTVSAFYGGVAGALVVFTWVGAANAQEFELNVSISILGMIIIGGLGRISGSFLGAAFVTLLPLLIAATLQSVRRLTQGGSVSADIIANTEHVVFGILILLFLIKEPHGLARLWERLSIGLRLYVMRVQGAPQSRSPKGRAR